MDSQSLGEYRYNNVSESNFQFYGLHQNDVLNCTPYWYYDNYRYWYPTTITVDTTKKAFEIVKILQDKKMIKLTTIKQFTDLVDEIIKVI